MCLAERLCLSACLIAYLRLLKFLHDTWFHSTINTESVNQSIKISFQSDSIEMPPAHFSD